jgi:membrane protease subunit (stomatin/prohibitin family)
MALFGKNANETAFVGGKKHWVDVIKNTGPGDLLIWRQPEEDFNTNSTVVVMPGEEAIFIKGGNIEQTFDSGTYKLSTENYPFISRLRNMFSGGISTFNCVVYFVRKSHSRELLWGTTSPLKVRDKVLGVSTEICSRGAYKIEVDNPVTLLRKLLGNNVNVLLQEELELYFSNEFQSKIRAVLTRALNERTTEFIGIESEVDEYSQILSPQLAPMFDDYGLRLVSFSISALEISDDELRQRYEDLQMKQREMIQTAQAQAGVTQIESQAAAFARRQEGQADADVKTYDYQAEQYGLDMLGNNWSKLKSAEILQTLAGNEGTAGGMAAAGAGIGMGMGAANVFAGLANNIFAPMQQQPQAPQPPAGGSGRFATRQPATSAPTPVPPQPSAETDPVAALEKLKVMLDKGLITQEVYNAKQTEILSRM